MAKLGDYIEQVRGVSYKPTDLHDSLDEESVTLLRANNIQDGHIIMEEVVYVAKNKVVEKQYLKKGDILICTSSGSKELVGKAAYIEENIPITFGAFCKVIRPKTECPKYIGYFFQSPYYRKSISGLSAGANINNIRNEHIEGLEIHLPPLNEQRRIAAVLDKVSDLIAKRRKQLDKLDELVKARFVEMFGNFIFDRDRWEICKVGSVADTIDPQPSHRTPPVSIDGIPYIGIAECNYETWHIDFEKARKVGKNVLREHQERYTLDNGDFIIGKIGTIGKPFPIPAKQTYTLSANTILIKPIKNKVMPQFLFAVFQSEFMDRIIDAEKKSTSQPAFGIQKVRNIEMPLPPMKLQQGFSDFVEQLGKSKLTIQQSLDKLEVLKKALMQQYFG